MARRVGIFGVAALFLIRVRSAVLCAWLLLRHSQQAFTEVTTAVRNASRVTTVVIVTIWTKDKTLSNGADGWGGSELEKGTALIPVNFLVEFFLHATTKSVLNTRPNSLQQAHEK